MTIEDHRDDQNNMDTCPLGEFSSTLPEKKNVKFSYEFPTFWPPVIRLLLVETDKYLLLSFTIKLPFWSAILDGKMNEIIASSLFIFFLLMLCTTSISTKNVWHNHISCLAILIRIWHLVMLTIQKNKLNTSKKRVSIPFSLHGSQRGLGFHLSLVFLCLPKAATTDMTC